MHISEMLDAPVDESALAIRNNITDVETALTEFDKISAGLADLHARFPVDLVYDVTTTKGMAEAVAHRAAWRDPRISVEKVRVKAKAPVLALGKDIDARAKWLTTELLAGEAPVDEQIKAEERRKEDIKQAKIAAEFGRVQAIQDAIGEIHMDAAIVAGKGSTLIRQTLDTMTAQKLDPLVFQEMLPQAEAAKSAAVAKLQIALAAAMHNEAEAARMAAERAELEQLRAQAAEQKRKDEAAAIAARKLEDDRLAAERKAAQEEQRRLDAEAAAARAAADREAAEQRKKDHEAHEAEMQRQRDAIAEQARIANERAAAERAERVKAEAAEQMVRDAAPTMLTALREIRDLTKTGRARVICDAAIKEATGE